MQWCDFMYFDMVLDSSSLGYMFLKELNGFRVLYCPLSVTGILIRSEDEEEDGVENSSGPIQP